jgi:FAD/FMN-containing dehydrogenase
VSVLERRRTRPRVDVDRAGLTRRLRETVEGEVRFDTAARALYATDASNFRQPPIGVVIPKTLDDVVAAHAACHEFGAPIVNRGCGTSLSGETVNVAVVVDHSKHLTAIGDPDTRERTVEVEPGAVSDKVNEHLSEWNLVFAPDPSTHAYCTIGGNVGNNSCGVHSVQSQFYGPGPRTSDNVHSLEILTHDGLRTWVGATPPDELDAIVAAGGRKGEIYAALRDLAERHADEIRRRFPPVDRLPRRVSGYNIDELLPEQSFNVARALTGTESTCVTVLRAKLLLTPALLARALVVVAYEDIFAAGDHVPQVLEHEPVGCEAIDDVLFADEQHLNLHPRELEYLPQEGNAWLLVEFGADTQAEADERAHAFIAALGREGIGNGRVSLFDDPEGEARLWAVREAGLAATAFPPDGDHWPGWEDSAVPPERVGDYLRDLRRLYERHGLRGALYGHLGQGCIHSRISFDLRTPGGLATYRRFLEEAADLVVSYGGSLSGEHGDGQQRAELLGRQFGDEILDAFREFKRIWDPDARMNPGKVVDPYRFDEDLKLGVDYEPWRPPVEFAYEEDGGDFAHAALRCVGVGKCRQPDAVDVMCPSFVVTREEMHTTRGRARLLFEMLEGDIVTDGWRSAEVMEALDLCLACKGCTADCPVSVDMPTYKAEFLHHHWAGRLRPRHAYAFGLVDKVARVASVVPEAANLVTRTPLVAAGLKRAAGMAPERSIPEFAPLTLQAWFHGRGERNVGGPRVLLWPDTFSNRFHSEVGVASVHRARGGRLPRDDAARPRLLRPAPVRLRLPRPREALPPPKHRLAPRRGARGNASRRARAELRGRLQGRAVQAPPPRRRRTPAGGRRPPLRRVPRGAGLYAAAARRQGAPLGPLPPEGDGRRRARADAPREHGRRGRARRRRVLRTGRVVGVRGRALRPLDQGRRARAPARRPRRRPGHARGRRRVLLQDADRRRRDWPPRAPSRPGTRPRATVRPGGAARRAPGAAVRECTSAAERGPPRRPRGAPCRSRGRCRRRRARRPEAA